MDEEPCTNFCGVLTRFHEVIKMQSFEFSVSDVIPTNVQNISPLVFFTFFVSFMEKNPTKFYGILTFFRALMKLRSFE